MKHILIAGCGDVGSLAGVELAAQGHEVWGLRRNIDLLPAEIRSYAADLTVPGDLGELPGDLDFVVYAAGADARDEAAYQRAYVEGLQNLLAALVEQGQAPKRIFYTSSTAVYAQRDGEWVDEESRAEPKRFSGRLVLEGEGVLAACPFPSTVLRLGAIYGPGREGLIERVRTGRAKRAPGRMNYTNRIHRSDAAGALVHLMGMADPEDLYLGVDCEPVAEAELLAWLADRLGVPVPEEEAANARRAGSKRCSNARLLATGYRFRYPTFREGFAEQLGGG